ncbi:hypothetical protein IFM89_039242 [Coptis chinensis]|uniref:Uncharacterized protein n=1 Tax=Coptis chinensis TaxID=261450 RepID=A0A835M8S0_9MAGN|nr:hypothetical protein IFM89_039242 [Coptis chinensis]
MDVTSTFAMIQNLMECTMKLALFTEISTIKFWYRKNVKVIRSYEKPFMIKEVKSEASTDNKCDDGDLSAQREAYGLGSDGEKPDGKAAEDSTQLGAHAEKAVYVAKSDKKKTEYNNSNTCRLTTRNWLNKTMIKMKRTL